MGFQKYAGQMPEGPCPRSGFRMYPGIRYTRSEMRKWNYILSYIPTESSSICEKIVNIPLALMYKDMHELICYHFEVAEYIHYIDFIHKRSGIDIFPDPKYIPTCSTHELILSLSSLYAIAMVTENITK